LLNIICPSLRDIASSCSQNLGAHATCATSRNLGGGGNQTCVANQPKLFQEILEKPKICVPVHPLLPQKILKKPKTCVHMQPMLPHEILQKPLTCVPVQPMLPQEILKNPKPLKWMIP
jgi:hypothetical protein